MYIGPTLCLLSLTSVYILCPDPRGYGDSDKPDGVASYTLDKLGKDIADLIPALGYSACILVGHDWGGAVAW